MSEPLDLDAIEARCETAQPGPWTVDGSMNNRHVATVGRHYIRTANRDGRSAHNSQTAEFIAHARTDVPALVAACRQLAVLVHDLRDEVEALRYDAFDAIERAELADMEREGE